MHACMPHLVKLPPQHLCLLECLSLRRGGGGATSAPCARVGELRSLPLHPPSSSDHRGDGTDADAAAAAFEHLVVVHFGFFVGVVLT